MMFECARACVCCVYCIPNPTAYPDPNYTATSFPAPRLLWPHGIRHHPDNLIGVAGARDLAGALQHLTGLKEADLGGACVLG